MSSGFEPQAIFVSATDTNVGKTFFAAELIKYLIHNQKFKVNEIAYYKPIQCGYPTDYDWVRERCPGIEVYYSYCFKEPASPNFAAKLENIEIDLKKIQKDFIEIQKKHRFVIVEGAGGLAVPINGQALIVDITKTLNLPLILVTRRDLGTINHTLLSVSFARNMGISIKGLWFRDLIDTSFNPMAIEDSIKTIKEISGLKDLNFEDCI